VNQSSDVTPQKHKARFFSAGHLLAVAIDGYRMIATDVPDDTPGQPSALISIIFSAAALEGFINEVAELAADPWRGSEDENSASIGQLATVLDEVERGRGSTRLKYQMAMVTLAQRMYPRGEQPYQDFDLLFRVRDALLHYRPEVAEFEIGGRAEDSTLVRALRSRNILSRFSTTTVAGWVSLVETRAAAKWPATPLAQ
jgi:hypothetical protein